MRLLAPGPRPHVAQVLLLLAAGLCGLGGLLVEHGLPPGPGQLRIAQGLTAAAVAAFLAELGLAWRLRGGLRAFLRARWPSLVLTALLVLQLLAVLTFGRRLVAADALGWLRPTSLTRLYVAAAQIYVILLLLVNIPRLHRRFAHLQVRPGLAFLLIFLVAILAGAGILSLPGATPPESRLSLVDALFTATSAVCVTGLIVRDTATEFSRFGQAVILVLIQLGGLGIMSLAGATAHLLGRGISVRESRLVREVFQLPVLQDVGAMLRFIVLWTLVAETLGTAVLYVQLGPLVADPSERLWVALFHAVSAFCNAGFSTYADSLVGWGAHPASVITVAALLIAGGLGFTVASNLLGVARARGRGLPRSQRPRLTLQTRVTLRGTLWLLAGGTALLLLLDGGGAAGGAESQPPALAAFFQAATCRTAGFNTVDLAAFSPASLLAMLLLMFVGAGPGSTAGGIKLTTAAVIFADLKAIVSGRPHPRVGDREIRELDRARATAVLTAGAALALLGTFALLITEQADLLTTAFEAVSALGTVGLSLGLTAELSAAGKVVVMVLMLVGRLGVLTVAYGLVEPVRDPAVRLPRGEMMIG